MAAAFQALLRGDTGERDRQCARATKIMDAQAERPKVDLGRDEIVARLLRLAEFEARRPLTEQETEMIQRHPGAVMKRLNESGYRMPKSFT